MECGVYCENFVMIGLKAEAGDNFKNTPRNLYIMLMNVHAFYIPRGMKEIDLYFNTLSFTSLIIGV